MKKTTKKGFTLIELLVVIAVIAILLAILIPTLKKVKEKARQTICKTHLRGIGLSIRMYLDDNKNRTYSYDVYGAGNGFGWYDPATGQEQHPDTAGTYWGLVYNEYAENPEVFSCPSYAQYKIDLSVYYPVYEMDEFKILGGYGINDFFQGLRTGYSLNVGNIRTPSEFVITQDHVEPRPEGQRDGDMPWIKSGNTYNLPNYRFGGVRPKAYAGIFRHSKKSIAMDKEDSINAQEAADRRALINDIPNGQSNVLYLDGSVGAMDETTGENVRKSWYTNEE